MIVRWTREALTDLQDIIRYIDHRNPQASLSVKHKIIMSSRRLSDFPLSGVAVHRADTRRLVVIGLPYILIYRVSNGIVKISSVLDARMDRDPDLI